MHITEIYLFLIIGPSFSRSSMDRCSIFRKSVFSPLSLLLFFADRIKRRCAPDYNRTTGCENAYITEGKRCTCRKNLCNTHYAVRTVIRETEKGSGSRMSIYQGLIPFSIFFLVAHTLNC